MDERQVRSWFYSLSSLLPALIQDYARKKAPQALMISGPFGVGKATLARLLSQALFCSPADEGMEKPCGLCPACIRTLKDEGSNLLVVGLAAKQRSVKVEQARNLLEHLASYPFGSGPRMVLLEMVDLFTIQAQNVLLKAIEEPDPLTYFILTCENERAVLPTVRSRCQVLRLPTWPLPLTGDFLRAKGIPKEEAHKLSMLSAGSPGRAMQIREDKQFWQAKSLADEHIIPLEHLADVPRASHGLRDSRELAELLLDYLEVYALNQQDQDLRKAKLLSAVIKARQYKASNLSWQSIIDQLLLSLTEEQPCQLS